MTVIDSQSESKPVKRILSEIRKFSRRTNRIPVFFIYVTAHGITDSDSFTTSICLSDAVDEDLKLDQDQLEEALAEVRAHNLVMFFDFCRSGNFRIKDLNCFDAQYQLNSSFHSQKSFNASGTSGFFTIELINGLFGAKKCSLDEGPSECQYCHAFRQQCSSLGVIQLQSLTMYVNNHLTLYTKRLKCGNVTVQQPSVKDCIQGELYPVALFPPKLEIRFSGGVIVDGWRCQMENLRKEGMSVSELLSKFHYVSILKSHIV